MAITSAGSGTSFNSIGADSTANIPKLKGLDSAKQEVWQKAAKAWIQIGQENGKAVTDQFLLGVAANIKAESNFDPKAKGDGGASHGLYQMNDNGAGAGVSLAVKQDSAESTMALYKKEKAKIDPLLGLTDAKQVASKFCTDVERPADKAGESRKRAALVDQIA